MSHGSFDLLARVLLSGPQSTSSPLLPEDHLIFGNSNHCLSPTLNIPIQVISPPGKMSFWLKLFSLGSKPKMFGPFLFFDGKISLIYHKRLFLDSQNERVSWPITSISFIGVFQGQSHSHRILDPLSLYGWGSWGLRGWIACPLLTGSLGWSWWALQSD